VVDSLRVRSAVLHAPLRKTHAPLRFCFTGSSNAAAALFSATPLRGAPPGSFFSTAARARKFYEETLGLKSGSAGNQGDNWWVEYDLPGGGCLALTNFTKEKPSDTAGGTIAFEVEDLDRLMTELKGKGVAFKSDVIHSPVCRMAVCLDSEGNSILLHQLKPK
jgi:predicted enzyme related to lactoylglutathione lyase